MITFKNTFAFGGHESAVELDFASLPQAAQEFIVAYGLRQYLNDGAAVAKDECDSEDERNKLKIDRINERVQKLRDGTMSQRGGGTRVTDPIQKIKREIATEILKAYAKANDITMWKGAELTAKIETFWEKNGDKPKIKAELDKRIKAMEALNEMGELDL